MTDSEEVLKEIKKLAPGMITAYEARGPQTSKFEAMCDVAYIVMNAVDAVRKEQRERVLPSIY